MLGRARSLALSVAILAGLAGCDKKASPSGPPEDVEWDRSCESDSDCVPSPGCCPAPCTEDVINKRELERAHAWVAKHCPKERECPSAGACPGHAYLCVRGTCDLVYDDEPDYRERQAP